MAERNSAAADARARESEAPFSREFVILLALVFLTFVFFIHEINQVGVNQIYLDALEVSRENKLLQDRIDRLSQEIELLETDQGIELVARKKLRLVKPGEILIKEYDSGEVRVGGPEATP